MKEKHKCPYCNGNGVYIDAEKECCGNYDMSVWCCGHFTIKEVQVQCAYCEATGYLKVERYEE